MKTSFPQFNAYACAGDSIKWTAQGFDLTATLESEYEIQPTDFECFSEEDIQRWKNDDWFYVGVVISVSFNGVELSDHAASLWGIECNFSDTTNSYLSQVAQELEAEAIATAKTEATRIQTALQGIPA